MSSETASASNQMPFEFGVQKRYVYQSEGIQIMLGLSAKILMLKSILCCQFDEECASLLGCLKVDGFVT